MTNMKLYYTIYKELDVDADTGDVISTGVKNVNLYKIENNELEYIDGVTVSIDDSSEESLQELLKENEQYKDLDYKLVMI